MERRNFIKALGILSGGIAVSSRRSALGQEPSTSNGYLDAQGKVDWKRVREQFFLPTDYAYFNTGGLGSSPKVVLDVLKHDLLELEVYPQPGHNVIKWDEVKEKCAQVFGCEKEEIALVSCATEGNNIVINGLPMKKGDEIITTTHEHVGGHIPLLSRAKRDGLIIKSFTPDYKNGLANVELIDKLITKRTRLIFLSHVTCTTGQLLPAKEIAELARARKIKFALDGAQGPGNIPINVREYGCDFYSTNGHKWLLGGKRTGIFYIKKDELESLNPITVGAYSTAGMDFDKRELEFSSSAQRFEYGTQNPALFHSLGAAIDFYAAVGLNTIFDHNRMLAEHLYRRLQEIDRVEVLSPKEEKYRTSMITFRMKGIPSAKISSALTEKQIRVRGVGEANLDAIRVSCHLYNSIEEVERLVETMRGLDA